MLGLVGLILMVPLTILHGWVLSLLWEWFFVPIFGLPGLRLIEAIGISVVINFFLFHPKHQENKEDREGMLIREMTSAFITPFVFLAIGWIVRSFM